jgi:uncharacterized peroxidase-related enzyme
VSHQEVTGSLGPGALHDGQSTEGRQPGGHGRPRASRGRRGAPGRRRLRRHPADRDRPFVWEFADPAAYARALASTGPAFEAIQAVGEEAFLEAAITAALDRVRDGLPLRAPIAVVGYTARKPATTRRASGVDTSQASGAGFLPVVETTPEVQGLYDEDIEESGYVMNVSRLWARQPATLDALFDLMGHVVRPASLSFRQRGILVTTRASTLGDAYCSLAWGKKLSTDAGPETTAGVLRGTDDDLDPSERALASWARQVTRDPNATSTADVQGLRDAGFDDAQIFAITVFVGLRIAFSTVNDALGSRPDHELGEAVPAQVLEAVTFGRPSRCPRPAARHRRRPLGRAGVDVGDVIGFVIAPQGTVRLRVPTEWTEVAVLRADDLRQQGLGRVTCP